MRTRAARSFVGMLGWVLVLGCAVPAGAPAPSAPEALPPPGFGTLRQSDVSLTLTQGPLRMMVTPLAESVIRVTAPDTWERLSALAERYTAGGPRGPNPDGGLLFLVTVYSESTDASFVPESVEIVSRGRRLRPSTIQALTAGWSQGRLRPREEQSALYAFGPSAGLDEDLVVVWGEAESRGWDAVIARVRAETARARARAGGSR